MTKRQKMSVKKDSFWRNIVWLIGFIHAVTVRNVPTQDLSLMLTKILKIFLAVSY
jgi:hypothetical protein